MYTERRCVLGFIIGSLVGRPSVIKHSAPWLTDDDLDAVRATLATGMIACGPQVELFQQAVATAQRARGAVLTGSGTAALSLGLRALDVGPSDEVVLPSYVCASVADAVRAVGASVILADVDPDSWLMTPGTVAPRISPATKAIILVHLFGISANDAGFERFGVPVIDDYCQAFGKPVSPPAGSRDGRLAVFSFHATKCLTTGEGGAITSDDQSLLAPSAAAAGRRVQAQFERFASRTRHRPARAL